MAQIITVDPLFERLPARERKYKEVVVFVHHYGGHKFSFKRHMEWVNDLGFDVITFDLPARTIKDLRSQFPLNKEWRFGLRHLWTDKIEEVLGGLAETKILYTFSYASMAALMAMERRHTIDIKAWVCDGGPFKQILRGFENLVREGELMENQPRFFNYPLVRNQIVKLLGLSSGVSSYDADVDRALRSLPIGFPVMSVRCEKDVLVGTDMIDDFFMASFGRIDFTRFTLQKAGHLLGFKEEGELYRDTVGTFLQARGTAL